MKCQVCNNESGKYPLCRVCNLQKEKGEIIKCQKCNRWHYLSMPCPSPTFSTSCNDFLYQAKPSLITNIEKSFYAAIQNALPQGYIVFPQMNLAAFINRTDNAAFHNELFRNVDFLITDEAYQPKIVIEINDQTHLTPDRKKRDEKVKHICEEAGIPIIPLWVSYGVNHSYIENKINQTLNSLPIKRVQHFTKGQLSSVESTTTTSPKKTISQKKGCYIATCVYGSYDCPSVWTLRRYRDFVLNKCWYGRLFISTYYIISPIMVKLFGRTAWFHKFFKSKLDHLVSDLQKNGMDDTPYYD